MSILIRPSLALFFEFMRGASSFHPVYGLLGGDKSGFCFGEYVLTPNFAPDSLEVTTLEPLEPVMITAPYSFDVISFYSRKNPEINVATAEIYPVEKGEVFQLDLLTSYKQRSYDYEEDLQKVLDA